MDVLRGEHALGSARGSWAWRTIATCWAPSTGRRDRAAGPRARGPRAGGRLPERPPHAGRHPGPGLRLLRLHRAQDARPHRHRRACGRPELLDPMGPFLGGGETISDVSNERSTWADLPWKFEAGTPPIAEAIGLGAAAEYLMGIGCRRCAPTSARWPRTCSPRWARWTTSRLGPRDPDVRGAAVSFSLPTCTPTTSRSSSTRRGSASAPATTAQSRAGPRGGRHGPRERLPLQFPRRDRRARARPGPPGPRSGRTARGPWAGWTTSIRS